jgi:hypothetical protein
MLLEQWAVGEKEEMGREKKEKRTFTYVKNMTKKKRYTKILLELFFFSSISYFSLMWKEKR